MVPCRQKRVENPTSLRNQSFGIVEKSFMTIKKIVVLADIDQAGQEDSHASAVLNPIDTESRL
jgi:hypothetical protein